MSQQVTDKITCPHCQREGEFEMWSSINVDLDPELKEKVFSGDLWKWKCPHCGEDTYIPWGTIYHDMKNKFMLFFSWDDSDMSADDKYGKFEVPDVLENMEGYEVRAVYGYNNFKERIMILQSHLNDIAIEHLRYMLSHVVHPEIAEQGSHLYLEDFNPSKTDKYEHGEMYFTYYDKKDKETYVITLPMETYYEHEFAVKNDARMELNGNICVDEQWIERQLKKSE